MAVLNIGEEQLTDAAQLASELGESLPGTEVLPLSVQLEAEAALLPADERVELLHGLGVGDGALPLFVRAAHGMLGLRTFLTTGEKESRAWTFKYGWKAPQCAGRIHTDFERGFIRAEVISYDDYIKFRGEQVSKDAGKWRLEGKEYTVQDGDLIHFRFNV